MIAVIDWSSFACMSDISQAGAAPGYRTVAVIAVWAFGVIAITHAGILAEGPRLGPLSPLQAAMAIPLVVFWLAFALVGPFRAWMRSLDPSVLVAYQLMRILGAAHLLSWCYGLMAGGFALPVAAGNFFITLFAGYTLHQTVHRKPGWRRTVVWLSVLGLAEFAMTFGLAIAGFLSVATPFDPATASSGYASAVRLPLSFYPSYLIPLFSLLHFVTLVRVAEPKRD